MSDETRCIKIRLKPDPVEKVRAWAKTLNERREEALATLRDESVILETVFRDRTAEGDFLIYVMKVESFERAGEAVKNSSHPIDEYHRNFKRDCRTDGERLETLVDLDRIREIQ